MIVLLRCSRLTLLIIAIVIAAIICWKSILSAVAAATHTAQDATFSAIRKKENNIYLL